MTSFLELDLESHGEIRVGPLLVDPSRFSASSDGVPLRLTNLEFRLLTFFCLNPGRLLRRDRIARVVWGGDVGGRSIDIHVSRLRRQLPPGSIQTIVKVGYRMVLPMDAQAASE